MQRAAIALAILCVACQPGGAESDAGGSASTQGTGSSDGSGTTVVRETEGTGTIATDCEDPEAAVAQIFATTCADAGCHGAGGMPAANLDLVSEGWQDHLVGQPSALCDGWIRVVPGDLDASLLADKLHPPVDCGSPMPVGSELSGADLQCIEDWIAGLPPVDCETCGGQACIDTTVDPLHCGGCDSPCPAGVPCEAGACSCPGGTTQCGDACVDTLANGQHCGGCNIPCEGGTVCLAGACVMGCGALTECDGGCVNTDTSALHCGGCGNVCPAGGACTNGTCECPGGPVGYAADIEPMMVASCTGMGCHGFPLGQEGLDLRAGSGYGDLVDVPSTQCAGRMRVAPGQPGNSYLLDKLHGVSLCLGTQMPKGVAPWPASDIDLVASWICQGAPP